MNDTMLRAYHNPQEIPFRWLRPDRRRKSRQKSKSAVSDGPATPVPSGVGDLLQDPEGAGWGQPTADASGGQYNEHVELGSCRREHSLSPNRTNHGQIGHRQPNCLSLASPCRYCLANEILHVSDLIPCGNR
jgi:hypothetical protein